MNEDENTILNFEEEKRAILETLHSETKAAFQRDYKAWEEKWIHTSTVTKTYINIQDSTFTESIGWEEIRSFVKTFIEEHPQSPYHHWYRI